MNAFYTIEFDGVVAAQFRASSQEDALDRYAISLGFVDYSHLLDRVPIHVRHSIHAISPDDDDYWNQTDAPRVLIQQK